MLFLSVGTNIRGLDFDPLGTLVASIDQQGACFISDLEANSYRYHMEISETIGNLVVYSKKSQNKLNSF